MSDEVNTRKWVVELLRLIHSYGQTKEMLGLTVDKPVTSQQWHRRAESTLAQIIMHLAADQEEEDAGREVPT